MPWREHWSKWQRPMGLLLGMLALVLVASRLWTYRDQVEPALQHSRPDLLVVSVMVAVLSQGFFALAWFRLLKAAGSRISRLDAFSSWSVSLAAKYVPGKVWQAVLRKSTHGMTDEPVLPQYFREQLISVGTACLVVAMHAPQALSLTTQGPFRIVALVGGMGLVWATMSGWLPHWLPEAWRTWWLQCRPRPTVVLQACLLNMAGYALLSLGLAVLLLGFSIEGIGITELASGLCFGGLVGLAAFFIPAGLGVREAGLYWFLAPKLGAGPAALVAIASRAWLITADCLLATLGISVSMARHLRMPKP